MALCWMAAKPSTAILTTPPTVPVPPGWVASREKAKPMMRPPAAKPMTANNA